MDKLRKLLPVAVLMGLCALILATRFHTYDEPLQRDLTTYAVIAHEMLNGKKLYSDLWDHKPPAIHVTYAAAEVIAGYGRNSIFLMNVAAALATLLICYWAGSAAGGGRIGGCFAAAFWALMSGSLALEANQPNTEVFMNVFLSAAFVLLVRSENASLGTLRAMIVGILFAVASLYKQVVVVQPLLLAIAHVATSRDERRKRAGVDILIIGATGVAIWAGVFAYFFARGSGAEFIDSVFAYNRYYSSNLSHLALHSVRGWSLSADLLLLMIPIAVLTAVGIVQGAIVSRERHWILLFVYIISSEIAVLLPGWPFAHYYQLLLPPLAIGAGWSVELIRRVLPRRLSSISYAAGAAVCAILVALQLPNYQLPADDWSAKKYGDIFIQTEQLAGKIDNLLARNETFYEWGSESGLYFTTGRRPPSGIFFAFPMLGGPLKEKLSARLIDDLNRSKPDLIVADVATMTLTEREHPVLSWFKVNYRSLARTDEFLLFARKGSRLDENNANLSGAQVQSETFPAVANQD